MEITREQAEWYAAVHGGGVDPDDVISALATVDENMTRNDLAGRYAFELWDKKSPINGVPATTVLEARDDIPEDGEVYLVRDRTQNNQIIFFQPYVAGADGFELLTDENWEEHATAHKNSIVEDSFNAHLMTVITDFVSK